MDLNKELTCTHMVIIIEKVYNDQITHVQLDYGVEAVELQS